MKNRKKHWIMIAVFVIMAGVAGCGKNMKQEREGELVFLDRPEPYEYNEQVWF